MINVDARTALRLFDEWTDDQPMGLLLEAVAIVCDDPHSSPEQIMRGLRFPGVVGETAALALHRRTGRSTQVGGICLDAAEWREWLNANQGHAESRSERRG